MDGTDRDPGHALSPYAADKYLLDALTVQVLDEHAERTVHALALRAFVRDEVDLHKDVKQIGAHRWVKAGCGSHTRTTLVQRSFRWDCREVPGGHRIRRETSSTPGPQMTSGTAGETGISGWAARLTMVAMGCLLFAGLYWVRRNLPLCVGGHAIAKLPIPANTLA